LPKILFLLENPATENRLRRADHAVRSWFDLDDEIEVYTATAENLLSEDVAIWPHESRRAAFGANLISQMTDRWRVLCASAVRAS
jgi:hypothetical protein